MGWGRPRGEAEIQPLVAGRGVFASVGDQDAAELAGKAADPASDEPEEQRQSTGIRSVLRKLLVSFLGVGVLGSVVGAGTFSSINATVTNSGNSFATGTLQLTNTSIVLSNNAGMAPGDIATGTITITNTGSLPGTMTLTATLNAATSTNFNQKLNLTIHDDTSGYCVYGHSSLPYNGACDSISGLTAQAATDAFPATNTGALTVPGTGGSTWASGEAHSFTVTVQVINSGTVLTGQTGALDLQWNATQTSGTSS